MLHGYLEGHRCFVPTAPSYPETAAEISSSWPSQISASAPAAHQAPPQLPPPKPWPPPPLAQRRPPAARAAAAIARGSRPGTSRPCGPPARSSAQSPPGRRRAPGRSRARAGRPQRRWKSFLRPPRREWPPPRRRRRRRRTGFAAAPRAWSARRTAPCAPSLPSAPNPPWATSVSEQALRPPHRPDLPQRGFGGRGRRRAPPPTPGPGTVRGEGGQSRCRRRGRRPGQVSSLPPPRPSRDISFRNPEEAAPSVGRHARECDEL
mmetsp:Transcript_72867/g.236745  ORF Transcript_72867/g.236745 Transcript_72867/m.236745 type:complete len:263 (-) Transcript_72867:83-871(-)